MPQVESVLVAHPTVEMRRMLRHLLAHCGVPRLQDVSSNAEAFFRLRSSPADLLICSHSPDFGEDGLRMLRRLRRAADSPCPTIPILVVLSRATRELVQLAAAQGADGVLALPLTRGAIELRLRDLASRPRVFVRTASYVGPCRRRRQWKLWSGLERRRSGSASDHTVSIDPDE